MSCQHMTGGLLELKTAARSTSQQHGCKEAKAL